MVPSGRIRTCYLRFHVHGPHTVLNIPGSHITYCSVTFSPPLSVIQGKYREISRIRAETAFRTPYKPLNPLAILAKFPT